MNWINAPLDDENDYIGLYLDSQPDENVLPVSVHRLNGQISGHIITDYFLPRIDFYNDTLLKESSPNDASENRSGSEMEREENSDVGIRSGLTDQCVGYCLAYHSRNKILARNCLKTNPNWMQESFSFIGTRALPSLMLPGSHNSGTYPRQLDKTVLHMINKYQINQDENIFNQLVYGIRHLDLRVGYSKVKQRAERLWIYHDIFRTEVSVSEVFEQVKRFLDMTSHEIIVMDFHRFTVGFQNEDLNTQRERHAKLIELIFRHLGHYIVPSYLGQHAPINEYLSLGKRLIIGYDSKGTILGSHYENHPSIFAAMNAAKGDKSQQHVRDIDASKQDQDESNQPTETLSYHGRIADQTNDSDQADRRMGSRIFNRLKSLRVISNSFSKRSIADGEQIKQQVVGSNSQTSSDMRSSSARRNSNSSSSSSSNSMKLTEEGGGQHDLEDESSSSISGISRASLFFPPVRHLWPNKDSIERLAQFMNETTCRKYFGELRSMMAELTPTVFGAISDKYDGNRKLAQLVNRPITDWIRDRWLHCINIVATDFFLGNDLIRLSIYANKLRMSHKNNVDLNSYGKCRSFRRVEHLLDKSKIPIQFMHHQHSQQFPRANFNDILWHTNTDGNQILLKLTPGGQATASRDRRESFVENVSDGLTNLFSSFKRLLNL